MKILRYSLLTAMLGWCCVAPITLHAEDVTVPEGVHYQRASDEVNNQARALLERYCANKVPADELMKTFGKTILVCAPGLWAVVKDKAAQADIKSDIITHGTAVEKDQDGKTKMVQRTGASFRREGQAVNFLTFFANSFLKNCNKITIRQATAGELRYFWATIPFDIDEPLFVIDADGKRYIINFWMKDGKIAMLWFDIVGDL